MYIYIFFIFFKLLQIKATAQIPVMPDDTHPIGVMINMEAKIIVHGGDRHTVP